jgi:formamidopyrimidine-DNA glycosylase
MPEGPEVKHLADELEVILKDAYLVDLKICGAYLKSLSAEHPKARDRKICTLAKRASYVSRLQPVIKYVRTHGKLMYLKLSSSKGVCFLTIHRGMSGNCSLNPQNHTLVELHFRSEKVGVVYYYEPRPFGIVQLLTTSEWQQVTSKLGPNVLAHKFSLESLKETLARPRVQKMLLGDALLDQRVLSGIGNYLRADILYQAQLFPWRNVASLSSFELEKLYIGIVDRGWTSYRASGHTLATYVQMNGQIGKYRPLVYGKKVCPLGHTTTQDYKGRNKTRNMWWCETCQV